MLAVAEVTELARKTIVSIIGDRIVSQVEAEPAIDSDGREALRILVTVRDDGKVPEGAPSRTLLALNDALIAAGDERFPFIEYATEAEIAEDAGTET